MAPPELNTQPSFSSSTDLVNWVRLAQPDPDQLSLNRSDTRSTQASNGDGDDTWLPIGPELHMLLVNGSKENISQFMQNWSTHGRTNVLEQMRTDNESNVLHIAAEAGQDNLIKDFLLQSCPNVAKKKNSKGDLPFHSAAKAGKLGALTALTCWESYVKCDGIMVDREWLREPNEEGDTPLHIAVENNELKMAEYLVDQNGVVCYILNKRGVTPMYLAIKGGHSGLVKHMISFTKGNEHKEGAEKAMLCSKSVFHAAVAAQNLVILEELVKNHKKVFESYDEEGRTPLSYAAFKGYHVMVSYLHRKFPSYAFKCDKDGSFPVHSAANGGHIKVINMLCNTKQLLNRKAQNILHVAAGNGQPRVVSYLLEMRTFKKLINSKDEDGNTPLHLATKGFHPRVVYTLTRVIGVEQGLQNKDGLTALDVVEIYAGTSPTFEAQLTWMALRYVDAPRSSQSTRRSYIREKQKVDEQNKETNDRNDLERYKNRIDTHLLVATLIATVTFAAGFTLPGGYKQDDPEIGMAVLVQKWAFQVFVICNTAAMYSAILSVVTLIWAHMSDLKLILMSLRLALPLLGFALTMMSLAFMMGVFVVLRVKHKPWLSYVVLGMGSVFLVIVLLFFIPLYNPSYIRNPVVRFFFSGTFLLLVQVCEKSTTKYV